MADTVQHIPASLHRFSTRKNTCLSGHLPDYPLPKGVSAPFAGFIGDWLVVAGGCNFPDIPASEGGKKVYYSQGYALDTHAASPQWFPLPDLPYPVAYGASVETPQGLVCIGGMNADSCLTQVYRLTWNEAEGFSVQHLPALPETIDNASATRAGNNIYVTGGNQQYGQNNLYTLNPETDSVWTKLTPYPGPYRVQPVLAAGKNHLFLAGGFQSFPESKTCILPPTCWNMTSIPDNGNKVLNFLLKKTDNPDAWLEVQVSA